MKAIRVEGLKYQYPNTERIVLDDISFEVVKGEFIGIVGRNTAGKSTLCFALAGLIPHFFKGAYGGNVFIDDLNVKQSEISEIAIKAGLVFDHPSSQMTGSKSTVFQEIAFGLENMGMERDKMIQRIEESLGLLNIAHLKDKNPFDLSGGQMQLVAICSVIAIRPDILILDEPTSQLDPKGTSEVFKVVENLSKEGMTIIMAEHKMERLSEYADKVLLLDDGKQIAFDTPESIFSRDDIMDYGIEPPMVTNLFKTLGIRDPKTGAYPICLRDIRQMSIGER